MSTPKQIFYVYCFRNINNNKRYIGETGNLQKKIEDHKSACGDCPIFHNAMKKYGTNGFEFSILGEYDTNQEALEAEKMFITRYKTNVNRYGDQYGYNLTDGGDGPTGYRHTDEDKMKMSVALKGRSSPNKGKKASTETLVKLSQSHMGQVAWNKGQKGCFTDETKQKMSNSHIDLQAGEKHPMYGKKMPRTSVEKGAAAKRGKYVGENSWNSKLTNEIAKNIRELYATGDYTYQNLSNQFNLGLTTIGRVISNPKYFSGQSNG